MRPLTETEQAIALANRVLDRPWADPDDDLAVLARQLLIAHEKIAALSVPRDEVAAPQLLSQSGKEHD